MFTVSTNQWGPPAPYQGPYPYPPAYPPPPAPGYGWGPMPPPPPRRRTGLVVALLLLAATVIAGAVVAALILREDDTTVTRPVATSAPTLPPASEPTPEPTPEPTDGPFPTTTGLPTVSIPTPTRTVPAKPAKPPPPGNAELVTRNRFYFTGLHGSVGCRESRLRLTDVRKAVGYYGQVKQCLDRAWQRQVRAAGVTYRPPRMIVFAGPMTSPCGGSDRGLSFYCPTNETVYMDARVEVGMYNKYTFASGKIFVRMWASFTVAHEYAHHLQQITGILPAYYSLRYDLPTREARLQLNRRMELQASCLSNVFLGANRDSYPIRGASLKELQWGMRNTRDTYRDHGSAGNHGFWSKRGFDSRNNAMCNTFTAAPARVS
jgi:uncharacterized protein